MRELDNRLEKHIDLLTERYPALEAAKRIFLEFNTFGRSGAEGENETNRKQN
jgi:hypothetical protein